MRLLLVTGLLAASFLLAYGKQGYLLTVPRVLQSNSYERLCLSLHDYTIDLDLNVSLARKGHSENVVEHLDHFPNGEGKCFWMWIPEGLRGEVKLSVSGEAAAPHNGTHFQAEGMVKVDSLGLLTFIQTDKPIYKPGQTVKFRILSVKPDLKPRLENVNRVWIEDPHGSRIMQWENVETQKGLGSLEMPLSSEPVLGVWKIKASIDDQEETQDFKVEEYVLPKYEITVNMPPYVLVNAETITGEICAKYTYGKPVKGDLLAEICVKDKMRGGRRRPCAVLRKPIDGCTDFQVSTGEVMLSSRSWSLWDAKIQVKANVTEEATGVSQSVISANTKVEKDILKIDLGSHSPDYFKPMLKFHGKCVVTKPDGTPAQGEVITVSVDFYGMSTRFNKNYTTDQQGTFTYTLPSLGDETSYTIVATAPDYTHEYKPQSYTPNEVRAYKLVKKWYSPSASFIQIDPIYKASDCHEERRVKVTYTTPENTNYKFHYHVMSRGNIVHTGVKQHHFRLHKTAALKDSPSKPMGPDSLHVGKFHINIPVLPEMSPLAHLLIYYSRLDGEVIADSTTFTIRQCFDNEVELEFSEESVLPGADAQLHLRADPGSLCAVGITDKSVHVLAGNNQLTMAKIFRELAKYDLSDSTPILSHSTHCADQLGSNDQPDFPDLGLRRPPGPPGPPGRNKRSHFPWGHYYSQYYDSSTAFKDMGMHVLSDLAVETRPCERHFPIAYSFNGGPMPVGALPDAVPVGVPGRAKQGKIQAKPKSAVELRNYFPETWLWELQLVDDSGEVQVTKEVPHTITDWMGSSICSNEETGLGVSGVTTLRAFQPFFVSFTLPYSVIRGEKVPITVTVFNYLSECLVVKLMLKNDGGYKILGDRQSSVCVCGGEAQSHVFHIQPKQIGETNITVRAESVADEELCGNGVLSDQVGARDAVTRKLLIEPEGREEEYAYSSFICLEGTEEMQETVPLPLPADIVPDSARGRVAVIGDIMGPTLSGLDKLLRMPTGCGEQNMLLFAPNIFVMQYLQNTQQVSQAIKEKALEFMRTGYQRELTYKHTDNSYSAFGNSDPEGSMWLTAFVVKSFSQAFPFIYIDKNEVEASINWFRRHQLENGCFPSVGRVIHKDMKGGIAGSKGSPAALTAYVLIAMLESGIAKDDPAVEEAVLCLNSQSVEDVYTIALMAYAYSIYNPTSRETLELLDQLDELAVHEDGLTHWERPAPPKPTPSDDGWTQIPYHQAASADVELTAYALMAYLQADPDRAVSKSLGIVRWLTKQRNAYGGFASTQDTVVALQALAQFAARTYSNSTDVTVNVRSLENNFKKSFGVSSKNSLLLQQADLALPNTLMVTTEGNGCVLLQASARYNVYNMSHGEEPAFLIRSTVKRATTGSDTCKRRFLNICTKFNGNESTNMAVIAVKMVSGWIPVKDSLAKLKFDPLLGVKRTEIDHKMVHLYFDELVPFYKCVEFEVEQDIEVSQTKPGTIHIYDYYDKELSTMATYRIKPTCGTKEELPHLTVEEYEEIVNNTDQDIGQVRIPVEFPGFKPINLDKKEETGCPVCLTEVPDDLVEKFCASSHAYRTEMRQNSRMKAIFDLRPVTKEALNLLVTFTVPEHCTCGQFTNAANKSKFVILANNEGIQPSGRKNRGKFDLDEQVTVIPIESKTALRNVVSKMKKTVKKCDQP